MRRCRRYSTSSPNSAARRSSNARRTKRVASHPADKVVKALIESRGQTVEPEPVANAQVDQLRNDGERRGKALRDAGNDLAHRHSEGVTPEFFGKAAVVDGARDAQALAAQWLRAAVAR